MFKTRKEYYKIVRQIEQKVDMFFNTKMLSLEQKARLCFNLRNILKVRARDSIKLSDQAKNFMISEPIRIWEFLLNKYNRNWKEIIAASMRTNPVYDRLLRENR